MKKSKLLIASLLAGAVAASVCAFTACNGDTPKPGPEEAAITDGVYERVNVSNGRTLRGFVKFYEDGTFYAEGLSSSSAPARGKYELVDNVSVRYLEMGDDGCFNPEKEEEWEVYTATTAIKLLSEDGTKTNEYVYRSDDWKEWVDANGPLNDGVDPCYVAFTNDMVHSIHIMDSNRTLVHNVDTEFTKADERAVLEKTFMVSEDSDKIDEIVTQQMLTLEIYDKKFVDKVSGTVDIEGALTKSGNVYTLTYKDGTATLTVSEDGKSAVWKKGNETIEYVEYAEPIPVAAVLEGDMNLTSGNKANSVKISLLEDGTYKVDAGSMNFEGTYIYEDDEIKFEDFHSMFTVVSATVATVDGKTTATVSLTATHPTAGTLTGTITGEVTGALKTAGAKVLKELKGNLQLTADLSREVTLTFKSDSTFTISYAGGELTTGFWSLVMDNGAPYLTFRNIVSNEENAIDCTVTSNYGDGGYVTTWTGKIVQMSNAEKSVAFSMPSAEFKDLQGATVAEKYAATDTWNGRAVKLSFKVDGTCEFSVADTKVATSEWKLVINGGIPAVNFSNTSTGEITMTLGSGKCTFTYTGKLPGSDNVMTIDIEIDSSELANLR